MAKMACYLTSCLNPTVNTQIGDIARIPFVKPTEEIEQLVTNLTNTNIEIKKSMTEYSFVELDFCVSPFKGNDSFKKFINYENHLLSRILINEAIINEKIFKVYDLADYDKSMVLSKEGKSISALPVSPDSRDAYLAEAEASKGFPLDAIREFIGELPTKENNWCQADIEKDQLK